MERTQGPFTGYKFRRQQPIGPYIVDFYCHEHRLVLELDGDQHYIDDGPIRDAARTAWLEARGMKVMQFSNHSVLTETGNVADTILFAGEEGRPSP